MTTSNPLLGILFMCGSGLLFPFMNGLVQVLSERYASEQIVWARITSHFLFMLALFGPRLGWSIFRSGQPGWQVARSLAQIGSTSFYFASVKFLPLPTATSISFMTPFVVTLLAIPFLGERISRFRLAALAVGFLGVLIVIRPGGDVFHWAAVGVLASSFFYGLYQLFTRKVASTDSAEVSVVYSALIGAAIMSFVMLFRWQPIQSWHDAGLMCLLGVFGGLGHYCVAKAFTYAPANVISPFMYFQLIGSVAVGYWLTGILPDAFTWLGSAVIIAAGIAMGLREQQERRAAVTSAAPAR